MNEDSMQNPPIGIPSGEPESQWITKIHIQDCGHKIIAEYSWSIFSSEGMLSKFGIHKD